MEEEFAYDWVQEYDDAENICKKLIHNAASAQQNRDANVRAVGTNRRMALETFLETLYHWSDPVDDLLLLEEAKYRFYIAKNAGKPAERIFRDAYDAIADLRYKFNEQSKGLWMKWTESV